MSCDCGQSTDGAATDACRFWWHAAVATAARLLLAASDWAPALQQRIEIATPASSLLRFRCERQGYGSDALGQYAA